MNTLLITPPFSQLNTPYPAMSYLNGFLKEKGYKTTQRDLGINVIHSLFSAKGLTKIFEVKSAGRIGALKDSYIRTIDPVMKFLRGEDPTLANRIIKGDYLPQSDRFDSIDEDNFSNFETEDRGKYLATLYLNDIGDYIQANIDPNFGFSRYSERLALSPSNFSIIENELNKDETIITELITSELEILLKEDNYNLIGITIPFPGNLIPALKISSYIKIHYPDIKIVIGGGWVNTELRNLETPKIFNYVDYIILDDGEKPFELLIESLISGIDNLHRTYILKDGVVKLEINNSIKDYNLDELPAPDYSGLDLTKYISLLDSLNPMHSLWNRGRWNKLTLAHGCYWKRCAFCDTSLPYIKDFNKSTPKVIVDKIEKMIEQTGQSGFHFVDEAAPPALLKELSLELLRRKITITWWTNIRFENSFNLGLGRLMAKSGCIGVSGGVEVASDRLLKFMDKGVTVDQVTNVTAALGKANIMVHAYLMYGFPTQSESETVDALEIVRQLFKEGLIQSAYWHQFALTAHSPVGKNPLEFNVEITGPNFEGFAQNDLDFRTNTPDQSKFSKGLTTSLYNYMRGFGFNEPLQSWFNFKIPKTTIKRNHIVDLLKNNEIELSNNTQFIWLGENIKSGKDSIFLYDNSSQEELRVPQNEKEFILEIIEKSEICNCEKLTLKDVDLIGEKYNIDPDFWLSQDSASLLFQYGLILI